MKVEAPAARIRSLSHRRAGPSMAALRRSALTARLGRAASIRMERTAISSSEKNHLNQMVDIRDLSYGFGNGTLYERGPSSTSWHSTPADSSAALAFLPCSSSIVK